MLDWDLTHAILPTEAFSSLHFRTQVIYIFAAAIGLMCGLSVITGKVRPVDAFWVDVSLHTIILAFRENLILVIFYGASIGYVFHTQGIGLQDVILGILSGILLGMLGIGLGRGPIYFLRPLQSKRRQILNEGIYRSIVCALWASVIFSALFATIFAMLFDTLDLNLLAGSVTGITFGTLTGLQYYGGVAILKHYLLRLLLHLHRLLPLRLIPFLEAMRERILLQRGGAHYRFIHRTFQEHLAALTDERIDAVTSYE